MTTHLYIALFHILFVAPLFLFVGFFRSNTPHWVYLLLLVIGLIVLVYHTYKLIIRGLSSSYSWVNLIHVLFVGPLLIYVGYYKRETLRFAYELLVLGGFGALGYHLFSAVKELQVEDMKK